MDGSVQKVIELFENGYICKEIKAGVMADPNTKSSVLLTFVKGEAKEEVKIMSGDKAELRKILEHYHSHLTVW